MQRIITVGREFGSGGRELGRRLAEELGYDYYDKEIIQAIADKTSLSVEYVKQVVESKPHNLFPITVANSFSYIDSYASQQLQSVYAAQCTILRELAQKSPCIIIGRCADYILSDMKPLRMFIYADRDSRVRRCLDREDDGENMSVKEMLRPIRTIDRGRAIYYEFYTGMRWGDKVNYDLCINTTNANIKELAPYLAKGLSI